MHNSSRKRHLHAHHRCKQQHSPAHPSRRHGSHRESTAIPGRLTRLVNPAVLEAFTAGAPTHRANQLVRARAPRALTQWRTGLPTSVDRSEQTFYYQTLFYSNGN
eukprot:758503-Hanusia_phi.AAC.1